MCGSNRQVTLYSREGLCKLYKAICILLDFNDRYIPRWYIKQKMIS